jgi:hypothetical protein
MIGVFPDRLHLLIEWGFGQLPVVRSAKVHRHLEHIPQRWDEALNDLKASPNPRLASAVVCPPQSLGPEPFLAGLRRRSGFVGLAGGLVALS